ncbi:MAG: HEPN domain-containing protein [Tissierellales bacterium]|nr:HEPN domain-containing protein [Tissierellales bacterium]
MTKEEKIILIKYRLDRSRESLKAAELMLENELYIPAMNRIYYSMFYAVHALLILNESAFSKHGQVKGFFNREYIKAGIFPKEFGKLFNTVFEYRQKFDYVDLIIPEKQLISDYINEANNFINTLSEFIKEQITAL